MVFLATPFLGSTAATQAQWAVVVNGIMGEQTSNQLIQDLEKSNDFVRQRVQVFSEIANSKSVRLPIHCFFETKKTQMLSRVLPRNLARRLPIGFTRKIVS